MEIYDVITNVLLYGAGFVERMLQGGGLTDLLQVDSWYEGFYQSVGGWFNEKGAAIDSFMIDLCNKDLFSYGMKMAESSTKLGRSLAAIFALIVAAGQAYKMMANGERLNTLAILRPIMFSFIFALWPTICATLMKPGAEFEKYMALRYSDAVKDLADARAERLDKAYEVSEMLRNQQVAAESAGENKGWLEQAWDNLTEGWDKIVNIIGSWQLSIQAWLFNLIEKIILEIGEMIFAVCVYIIFMLKALYLTVLVMFGPLFIACSILDIWKDVWSQWLGRLITVSLYGGMAYLVMIFATNIITFSVNADTAKMAKILVSGYSGVMGYLQAGFGTCIMSFVAYLVGAIAMTSVPDLANMAFPSQGIMGASHFITGMKGYGKKIPGASAII